MTKEEEAKLRQEILLREIQKRRDIGEGIFGGVSQVESGNMDPSNPRLSPSFKRAEFPVFDIPKLDVKSPEPDSPKSAAPQKAVAPSSEGWPETPADWQGVMMAPWDKRELVDKKGHEYGKDSEYLDYLRKKFPDRAQNIAPSSSPQRPTSTRTSDTGAGELPQGEGEYKGRQMPWLLELLAGVGEGLTRNKFTSYDKSRDQLRKDIDFEMMNDPRSPISRNAQRAYLVQHEDADPEKIGSLSAEDLQRMGSGMSVQNRKELYDYNASIKAKEMEQRQKNALERLSAGTSAAKEKLMAAADIDFGKATQAEKDAFSGAAEGLAAMEELKNLASKAPGAFGGLLGEGAHKINAAGRDYQEWRAQVNINMLNLQNALIKGVPSNSDTSRLVATLPNVFDDPSTAGVKIMAIERAIRDKAKADIDALKARKAGLGAVESSIGGGAEKKTTPTAPPSPSPSPSPAPQSQAQLPVWDYAAFAKAKAGKDPVEVKNGIIYKNGIPVARRG